MITKAHREFWFKTTANGQRRAYFWAHGRTFAKPIAEAEALIAAGQATEINQSWMDAVRTGTPVVTIR